MGCGVVVMNISEALEHCRKQQNLTGKDDATVGFFLPGQWGKTNKKRLCKGGPAGEIVQDNLDGRGVYVLFKANEVIAYMTKVGKEAVKFAKTLPPTERLQ